MRGLLSVGGPVSSRGRAPSSAVPVYARAVAVSVSEDEGEVEADGEE